MSALLAAALLAASTLAPAARPAPAPLVVPYAVPAPSWCWQSIRLFDTLRYGPVDFCRENLRYVPGRLECYQFLDQVCTTLLPDGQWVEARNVVQRSVFHCPSGPPPPVCRRLDIR